MHRTPIDHAPASTFPPSFFWRSSSAVDGDPVPAYRVVVFFGFPTPLGPSAEQQKTRRQYHYRRVSHFTMTENKVDTL